MFEKICIPEYESLLWPMTMMFSFVEVNNVLRNIAGWGTSNRFLMVAGEKDNLVGTKIMAELTDLYQKTASDLLHKGQLPSKIQEALGVEPADHSKNGIKFAIIPGAGHHLQNDLQWEDTASRILDFLEKLD